MKMSRNCNSTFNIWQIWTLAKLTARLHSRLKRRLFSECSLAYLEKGAHSSCDKNQYTDYHATVSALPLSCCSAQTHLYHTSISNAVFSQQAGNTSEAQQGENVFLSRDPPSSPGVMRFWIVLTQQSSIPLTTKHQPALQNCFITVIHKCCLNTQSEGIALHQTFLN